MLQCEMARVKIPSYFRFLATSLPEKTLIHIVCLFKGTFKRLTANAKIQIIRYITALYTIIKILNAVKIVYKTN